MWSLYTVRLSLPKGYFRDNVVQSHRHLHLWTHTPVYIDIIYVYTHAHTHIHIHKHTCIYTNAHTHKHVYIHAHMHIHIRTRIRAPHMYTLPVLTVSVMLAIPCTTWTVSNNMWLLRQRVTLGSPCIPRISN